MSVYKILIVEDDISLCNNVKEGLEKWGFEGYRINEFDKIFEEFAEIKPHLVLMDINLPCFDGFYWCNKIRSISKVPIVFLSSRDTKMDVIMAVNMGGDDYITKPFSMDILIAKIQAILRRTYSYQEGNSEIVEYQNVVLNLSNGRIYYEKKELELTKNELRIMNLLMKQHGKIISRDRIMRVLWNDDTFINDNTLTVNVNRLRTKLKDIGLDHFIKTKKGQGYVIA